MFIKRGGLHTCQCDHLSCLTIKKKGDAQDKQPPFWVPGECSVRTYLEYILSQSIPKTILKLKLLI